MYAAILATLGARAYVRPMPYMLLSLSLAAHLFAADTPPIDYAASYDECTKATHASVDEALKKCEEPARGGVPGAQYVMGALLTNRAKGDDSARGIEWLDKAVEGGSPAATYFLAVVLSHEKDDASIARSRDLFKRAICAGYPEAKKVFDEEGGKLEALGCPNSSESDFTGEWRLSLKWEKSGPAGTSQASYKVSIGGGTAHVSMEIGGKWTEVKPGQFTVTQKDQTIIVSATDVGWDYDGKWIESWTLQLMRTGDDTASVAYLRTVNNPNVPSRFKWRTFSSYAEGTAKREKE
jgi:hypothetical protein